MGRQASGAGAGTAAVALAALLGLGSAAAAQDATAAGGASAEDAVTHKGSAGDYVVVTADDLLTFTTNEFEAVAGMSARVYAERRSNLVVTFTAECAAKPEDAEAEAAVRVRVLVDGVAVTGANDLLLCSNKQFYLETHGFQWAFPVEGKRRREVTVEAAYFPGTAGKGEIADRVLRIDYDAQD
ncbi:MAG: hypothetical protein IT545_10350 [Rhodobacteraceae bacterium]|nr:hypothetical protein [Paracoccaceae bacterium]